MIKLKDEEKLKWFIGTVLRSYNERSVYTLVKGSYAGCAFESVNNRLRVSLRIEVKSILGGKDGKESKKTEVNTYDIRFHKDLSHLSQHHFDNLLTNMSIRESAPGCGIVLNKNENYYDILYDAYKLFYVDILKGNEDRVQSVRESFLTVTGTSLSTAKGDIKLYIHNLSFREEETLFVLEETRKGYNIKFYGLGRVITLKVGRKIELEKGEYKRLPNGSKKVRDVLLERYRNKKSLQDGTPIVENGYKRALNQIKTSGANFDKDNEYVYKNSNGSYFRVEFGSQNNMPTITFYHLTDDLQGTNTGSYYLSTIFRGEFNDLDLWGDVPEWFIDGHVLADIYEDHVEGKYELI